MNTQNKTMSASSSPLKSSSSVDETLPVSVAGASHSLVQFLESIRILKRSSKGLFNIAMFLRLLIYLE